MILDFKNGCKNEFNIIITKNHAADPEKGFLSKSSSKSNGCGTAMPTTWELTIYIDLFAKSYIFLVLLDFELHNWLSIFYLRKSGQIEILTYFIIKIAKVYR